MVGPGGRPVAMAGGPVSGLGASGAPVAEALAGVPGPAAGLGALAAAVGVTAALLAPYVLLFCSL